jgi:hypothetical protein
MKFPKNLYGRVEGDAPDEYVATYDDIDAVAEVGTKHTIGIYKLVEVVTVSAKRVILKRLKRTGK